MAKAPIKKKKGPNFLDGIAKLAFPAKVGLFVGVGVVLCGAFYALVYMPFGDELTASTNSRDTLKQSISRQRGQLVQYKAIEDYGSSIEQAYTYVQKFLPKEDEVPRLVQMVSDIGAQAGLSDGVTRFAPVLPAAIKAHYAEIPFTMELKGEFLTVLKFLYDFSRMDRIVNITNVDIGSPQMVDSQNETFHISVKCSGSTYRSLTEDEESAASNPKK